MRHLKFVVIALWFFSSIGAFAQDSARTVAIITRRTSFRSARKVKYTT